MQHINLLSDYVKKNGSWLNVDYLYSPFGITYPKSGFEIDNNELLEHIEFENLVDEVINRKGGLKEKQNKVQDLNREILRLIHVELEKKKTKAQHQLIVYFALNGQTAISQTVRAH